MASFKLRKVPLGELHITPLAASVVTQADALTAVTRHARGDHGSVSSEEFETNDVALHLRGRVKSVYETVSGETFWLLTDVLRGFTMVALPADYE